MPSPIDQVAISDQNQDQIGVNHGLFQKHLAIQCTCWIVTDSVIAKRKKNTMRPKGKTIHGEDKSNSKRLNSNDNGIHYNPTIMAFAKPSQTWPTCRRLFGSVPMTHRFAPRLGKSDLISVGKSEYVICWFTPSPSFTAFFGSHGPLHASGYTWIHPLRVCRVQWCPKNDQSSQVECPHLNHCTTAPRIQERSPRQLLK